MKRLFLLTALLAAACLSFAAIDEYYAFAATTGTYTPITGTTISGISTDDAISAAIPLGFDFPFGTTNITQIKVSSNGWIDLGGNQIGSNLSNNLASTTIRPVIAPLWDDTSLANGSAQYLLTGSAPNRVFTVQYNNLRWNYNSNSYFNLQARIYETGKIDIIYGSSTGAPSNPSASIGINMAPGGSGWFYSVSPGSPATASTTAANNYVTTFPAQGTVYEFNPVAAVPNDLEAMSIMGNSVPTVGIASDYTIAVRNCGSDPQTVYQVKLFHGAEVEIGSVTGTEIQPNQILNFVIPWTPSAEGDDVLYGKVVLGTDQNPANDQTPDLNVGVLPPGLQSVTIGSGTENLRIPLDFYYRNSLFECLYYPAELGFPSGSISALQFYNHFATAFPNGATKLWLGTTTEPDLDGGWIPSTQLTLVFDGTVQYPSGSNTITIPLQTPFTYNSGNLVLLANRPMDTAYYSANDLFKAQDSGNGRSRRVYSDNTNLDPANPSGGNISGTFPQTTVIYSPFGTGALQGTIFGVGNLPLADATVTVTGTTQSYTTGADGTYVFPNLLTGTVEVTASHHGYITYAQEASIVEDQTATLDFYLQQMPMVTLSGRVVGSDDPLAGLAGAAVAFTGYEDYSVTTGAGGYFSIPGVYGSQNYAYTASKEGYTTVSGQVEVGDTDLDLGSILLTEIALPPVNVVATEAGDLSSVLVTWSEPGTFLGQWIHYDSGENYQSIGTGGAADFTVAIRYPASALADFAGTSLQAIKFWPASNGSYWLRVWTGGSSTVPGSMVVDQAVTPVINTYNSVLLDSPVLVTGTEELWFGYRVAATGYPAGCDAGPAIDGFGNMIYWQNTWSTLIELSPSLNYNWNIQGFVGYNPPTRLTHGIFVSTSETGRDRVLQGYQVWRLLSGDEANETAWTSLTPTPVTETSFTDLAWVSLPSNIYKYAVKAVYSNSVFSTPAFSNAIETGMMGILSGNVTDYGTSGPVEGAVITAGEFSGTSNGQGHYQFQVYQGTYTVTCVRGGYQLWSQENVWIPGGQNTTLDIVLRELTFPASGVSAVPAANQASAELSWRAAGSGSPTFTDGFEDYEDFALTFAPWTLIDGDQRPTYGLTGNNFPNESSPMAWIIFNPSATTPPITNLPPHGGAKMAACFSCQPYPTNDDWLIAPAHTPEAGDVFSFWARSYTASYGLERFTVAVSTTGTAPADFTVISGYGYIQAPVAWTNYSFDLTAYAGQEIYVAVHCVSDDAFILFVDDVLLGESAKSAACACVPALDGGAARTDPPAFRAAPRLASNIPTQPGKVSRMLIGYQVSRLLAGSENNEAAWDLLTATAISDTHYTDSGWGAVPPGNYRWAVKSYYKGGLLSEPAFSNVLPRNIHNDLAALSLSGDLTPVAGLPAVYTLLAGNAGNAAVSGSAYSARLMNGAEELASLSGFDLLPGASHEFAFDWTPADPGALTLTALIVFSGDAVPANDAIDLEINIQEPNVPVELSSFTAIQTTASTVRLAWVTQSETGMLGYRVYRANTAVQSSAVLASGELIPATNTSAAQTYVFTDAEVESGQTWFYWLESVEFNQSAYHGPVYVTLTGEEIPLLPELSALRGAYPNPFRFGSATRIGADVKAGETGTLAIYNVSGQLVRTFSVNQGSHSLLWDGRDASGRACGSGIYFCRLSTPSLNQTRKLMLIK